MHHSPQVIMSYGLTIIATAATIFSLVALTNHAIVRLPNYLMIGITILNQMSMSFGICMVISNALALSLIDYKHAIGTASSLFGFFYYCLISLFTLGMGVLHNGTLLTMPLYFFCIAVFMKIVQKIMIFSSNLRSLF